jgi:hypothetical protein
MKVAEVTELAIFDAEGVLIDSDQNPSAALSTPVTALWPAGGPGLSQSKNTNRGPAMPICQTAHSQVRLDAADRVKTAIEEFVRSVTENEAGSRLCFA